MQYLGPDLTNQAGVSAFETPEVAFVATGSISDNAHVALRSDGTVEAISGTETLMNLGADNTQISAANALQILDAVWHEATGKLAVLFRNDTTTDTLSLVLGTVSGGTITFGTVGIVEATHTNYNTGKIVFNAAGTLIFAYYISGSNFGNARAASISGTTLTFGAVQQAIGQSTNPEAVFLDEAFSYLVCVSNVHYATLSYSGTTLSAGISTQLFTLTGTTNRNYIYDATNHRLIIVGYTTTTTYVIAFVIAVGSVTNGTEISLASSLLLSAKLEPTSGKVLLVSMRAASVSQASAYVVTFNVATPTINTGVFLDVIIPATGAALGGRFNMTYNATLGKFLAGIVLGPGNTAPNVSNIYIMTLTISGTSVTFTTPQFVFSNGHPTGRLWYLFANAAGTELAFIVVDELDGQRARLITAKNISDVWTVTNNLRIRETPMIYGAVDNTATWVQAGWAAFDLGNWNLPISATSYNAVTLKAAHLTFPTESSNADAWIGVAQAAVTNGQTVLVRSSGVIDYPAGGLLTGLDYYLGATGALTLSPASGRFVGRAIAANKILMDRFEPGNKLDVSRYVEAIQQLLDEAEILRDDAQAARDDAEEARDIVLAISEGPVISINGQGGVIDGIATLEDAYALHVIM